MSTTKKYTKKQLANLIIYPDKNANKYSRGTCVVVAGSEQYPGASILCARAAQRTGSGYTMLYTDKSIVKSISCSVPSCVCAPFEKINFDKFLKNDKPKSFIVGPGFVPGSSEGKKILQEALQTVKDPVVIDGGALSHLKNKNLRQLTLQRSKNKLTTIITPHTGEALTLTDFNTNSVSTDKEFLYLAKMLYEYYNATVVLKDKNTYIYNDKFNYIMKNGTPALSKAGSGDVLAGILGGILCQNKIDVFDACALATNIHAMCAINYSKNRSCVSLIPEDLLNEIPLVLNSLK